MPSSNTDDSPVLTCNGSSESESDIHNYSPVDGNLQQHNETVAHFHAAEKVENKFSSLLDSALSHSGCITEDNINSDKILEERSLCGTTMYVAECSIDTHLGLFHTYVFQDYVGKHYVMALTYGEIVNQEQPLYIRLHSSCVTSETLRACDCDCVQQLEGAMKIISERKHGILFYLLQEGRGAGYVGKARDRMLVQASYDEMSTFEAYHAMGLKKDHRQYENIPQICHLLGISDARFIVLTNNPDKIQALTQSGMHVLRTERLEFEPSPFNIAYLSSKQASGHLLQSIQSDVLRYEMTFKPVTPFKPYLVADTNRFIFCASYYLPMKPVNNEILLNGKQFQQIFELHPLEYYMHLPRPCVLSYERLRADRYIAKIDSQNIKDYQQNFPDDPVCKLLTTPHWFKSHVYYDIVTSHEFVVLTYGTNTTHDYPMVLLLMESLFNRFLLRNAIHRKRFKNAVKLIVRYGFGIIMLLSESGRGASFGAYALDRMLLEQTFMSDGNNNKPTVGVSYDEHDYDSIISLLKIHAPQRIIQMIMNRPTSILTKIEYINALKKNAFEIKKWLFLESEDL